MANKIPLKDMLSAVDRNDKYFYRNLTAEQKKEFSPWLAMRYTSSVRGSTLPLYLIMTHEIVNRNFSDLSKHPELQWMLLSLCGVGSNQYHDFIRPGGKRKKNRIEEFLSKIYPNMKRDEIELLQQINDKKELKDLAREYGYQEDEIKEIFK